MNLIIILMCAFVNRVTSQTNVPTNQAAGILPAKILAQQRRISENSDLYVTCSTFGVKKQAMVYIYLCKDDIVINTVTQRQDQDDTTITISRAGLNYSGNYSCFYSTKKYSLMQVSKKGLNIIEILVIDISVAGLSTVTEGDDVEFRCSVSDTLQTLSECQLIHSYLMRNEIILQVQAFNVTQMKATFTIKGAMMRDSGHYDCVVLPSKCVQEREKTLNGNNRVLLEVKEVLFLRVFISFGLITLMLIMALGLWCIKKRAGQPAPCDHGVGNQQANAVMQQQIDEENLERLYAVRLADWKEHRAVGDSEEILGGKQGGRVMGTKSSKNGNSNRSSSLNGHHDRGKDIEEDVDGEGLELKKRRMTEREMKGNVEVDF